MDENQEISCAELSDACKKEALKKLGLGLGTLAVTLLAATQFEPDYQIMENLNAALLVTPVMATCFAFSYFMGSAAENWLYSKMYDAVKDEEAKEKGIKNG